MKKYITGFKLFIFLMLLLPACESEILDKDPIDRYSDALVWNDINLIETYLYNCYHSLGNPNQEQLLSSSTDDLHFIHGGGIEVYTRGNISSASLGSFGLTGRRYDFATWWLFNGIHKFNLLISNIEDLIAKGGTTGQKASQIKGETLFLRAYAYTQLARNYGGLPLLDKPFIVGDEYLDIVRASFEETVNFIVADCEAAFELLGTKAQMPMGRATKEAALALKARILHFAASDLTADGNAVNQYVGYANPNRQALWTAAKNAAKAVIDFGTCDLADFGAPDLAAVAENYYEFFRQKNLSHPEIIWGKMFDPAVGQRQRRQLWDGANGNNGWGGNSPTQNLVDAYQMADGTSFWDHFEVNDDGYYINVSETYGHENPYYNRDPRFYGSIQYDSAVFRPRIAALAGQDPLGIYSRRTRRSIVDGNVVSETFGLDTRQGPLANWNGTYSGYIMRKMIDKDVDVPTGFSENIWIHIRYAEIILNYAEACLELGEAEEAANYINMIRNRAGLPDFTGDIREALRYERRIEFVFEDNRFYDIRRWKILDEAMKDAHGMDIVEVNEDGIISTTWRRILVDVRNFESRMYWIPILQDEMNRAPQLVQNPGY